MDSLQRSFGFRVRRLRKSRGWTQEQLAARCRMHWTYVGGIERGERNPTLRIIASLAKALGVPPSRLLSSDREGR
ncbi:MAG: helix-turn-helix transcriptional regulator [Planctomycetota bacterium]|nr:helix-turn-helix transcriptional regulator [Planctomycetota bacterium]